jgi:short chain dehydrogenase
VLDVNLIGVINGVHAFLPILTEQDEGHIVKTASIAGLTPWPGCAPYAVSKYGIVGLSEVLYAELRQRGPPSACRWCARRRRRRRWPAPYATVRTRARASARGSNAAQLSGVEW